MATEVLSPCFFYITKLKHCARNYITYAFICFLSILSIYLDLYGFKIKRNTFHWFKMVDARWRMVPDPSLMIIDLFTDSAAILNLLDLRSIMGCTGGTRSEFTLAFRPKRELHCIFLGKKVIIITSKHGTTIFFSHYNLSRKTLRKIGPKSARIYTERVYLIVPMPPGHPIVLPKSNTFNIVAVSVKRSIDVIRTSLLLLQIFMG